MKVRRLPTSTRSIPMTCDVTNVQTGTPMPRERQIWDPGAVKQGWEDRAQKWIEWARRPGFDGYWSYRDFFFDEVVPRAGRATLEGGCGEGRVARDLRDRGHPV